MQLQHFSGTILPLILIRQDSARGENTHRATKENELDEIILSKESWSYVRIIYNYI